MLNFWSGPPALRLISVTTWKVEWLRLMSFNQDGGGVERLKNFCNLYKTVLLHFWLTNCDQLIIVIWGEAQFGNHDECKFLQHTIAPEMCRFRRLTGKNNDKKWSYDLKTSFQKIFWWFQKCFDATEALSFKVTTNRVTSNISKHVALLLRIMFFF